jgi:hypothetical protein
MQQTIPREVRKVRNRRTVDSRLSADDSSGMYERFLEMPVPMVLAAMWLAGVALLSAGALTLYTLVALAASALGA